jgi:hypothetical protein
MAGSPQRNRLAFGGAVALAIVLIVLRSAVFTFWPQAYFDSDQAIFGLMAKHIVEGRAFPVFMYGSIYILAVEAWLAAPLFALAGVSVAALKLPLVLINLVTAYLLLRLLTREAGLRPIGALVASLFFLLPAPGTASKFADPSGGNLEPFLYAILIWLTRARPVWCGLVLGIGFLQREFTIYALAALLVLEAAHRILFTWDGIRKRVTMLVVAGGVWLVVFGLKQYSTPLGPGTTVADLRRVPGDNLHELFNRVCIDPSMMIVGLKRAFTDHLPRLFGTVVEPVSNYSIESTVWQGLHGAWPLLAAIVLIAAIRIVMRLGQERTWRAEYDSCAYLALVGALSLGGFSTLRCGAPSAMRYELLSIIGVTGLGAWYLCAERVRPLAAAWMALVIAFTLPAGYSHARLWAEYLTDKPVAAKMMIIRGLQAQGVRYASADYWLAYYITFMTRERIIVASEDFERISSYRHLVDAHASEGVRVLRRRCEGGRQLSANVYACPRSAAKPGASERTQ